MIRRLQGELVEVTAEHALVRVAGVSYQIHVSPATRDLLAERELGSQVELSTYHYLQTDGNRITPYLLGFESDRQRELFEELLAVPRLGPLSALRAMILPVGDLARAIELGDEGMLRKLPGVARQRARDMVATLQGKLARFLEAGEPLPAYVPLGEPQTEPEREALAVLEQLGLSRADALRGLRQASTAHPEATTADELVRLVFQQR